MWSSQVPFSSRPTVSWAVERVSRQKSAEQIITEKPVRRQRSRTPQPSDGRTNQRRKTYLFSICF